MAEITAALVKELRDRTLAGMMDCKRALAENDGDIEAAIDWLRTKGLAAAAKKASRVAAEGLVGVATDGTKGSVVEVNSETDFVAKNEQFQDFVRNVTQIALAHGITDADALGAADYPTGGTVAETLTHNVATIGENQSLRRAAKLSVSSGVVTGYVHNAVKPGLGKIGVLVALESTAGADVLEPLAKQLAMHVAAANPLALNGDDLDPEMVARERAIAEEKASQSGKPADIVAKMVDGSMAKFRKENALLSQLFVMDGKTPVAEVVAAAGKDVGAAITLKGFVRFQLGEGIEKAESDFAAEVAAAAGV
jgi:elongation factor Ts